MAGKKITKKKSATATIANNKSVRHNYFVEDSFEAGLVLEGWEVKSLREGRIQLKESHISIQRGEAWLQGAHISALTSASTHIIPNAIRSRKLLLHRQELNKLIGNVERKGYTLVPLSVYWKNGHIKLSLGLAKGKKLHDKRATAKDRDWQREKSRIMKQTR